MGGMYTLATEIVRTTFNDPVIAPCQRGILTDSEGVLHMFYMDDNKLFHKSSSNHGYNWSDPYEVQTEVDMTQGYSAIVSTTDDLLVVYIDVTGDLHYSFYKKATDSWVTEQIESGALTPELSINKLGYVMVVFIDSISLKPYSQYGTVTGTYPNFGGSTLIRNEAMQPYGITLESNGQSFSALISNGVNAYTHLYNGSWDVGTLIDNYPTGGLALLSLCHTGSICYIGLSAVDYLFSKIYVYDTFTKQVTSILALDSGTEVIFAISEKLDSDRIYLITADNTNAPPNMTLYSRHTISPLIFSSRTVLQDPGNFIRIAALSDNLDLPYIFTVVEGVEIIIYYDKIDLGRTEGENVVGDILQNQYRWKLLPRINRSDSSYSSKEPLYKIGGEGDPIADAEQNDIIVVTGSTGVYTKEGLHSDEYNVVETVNIKVKTDDGIEHRKQMYSEVKRILMLNCVGPEQDIFFIDLESDAILDTEYKNYFSAICEVKINYMISRKEYERRMFQ